MTKELGTSCPFCGKWIDDMTPDDVKDIEDEYEGEKPEYCPIHFQGF